MGWELAFPSITEGRSQNWSGGGRGKDAGEFQSLASLPHFQSSLSSANHADSPSLCASLMQPQLPALFESVPRTF
jgi:hypothetical protein